jgi:hypothetical protein
MTALNPEHGKRSLQDRSTISQAFAGGNWTAAMLCGEDVVGPSGGRFSLARRPERWLKSRVNPIAARPEIAPVAL